MNEIVTKLAAYFMDKHCGDIDEAYKDLLFLQISSISIGTDGAVTFHTARPGMFIGAKGRQHEAISNALGCKIKIVETNSPIDPIYSKMLDGASDGEDY